MILTLIADELNKDAAEFSSSSSSASSPSLGGSGGLGNGGSGQVLSSTAIAASASVVAASALDRDGSGGVCTSELASGESGLFSPFFRVDESLFDEKFQKNRKKLTFFF